jgi:hypothetical protein
VLQLRLQDALHAVHGLEGSGVQGDLRVLVEVLEGLGVALELVQNRLEFVGSWRVKKFL